MSRMGPPKPITTLSDSDGEATVAVTIKPLGGAVPLLPPAATKKGTVADLPGLAALKDLEKETAKKAKAAAKAKAKGKATAKSADKGSDIKSDKDAAAATASSKLKRPASAHPPPQANQPPKKAKDKQTGDAESEEKKAYILMKYAKHGIDGTWAIRKSGAHQVLEINVPKATSQQNLDIADVVLKELNENKVNETTAKAIAAKLKEALAAKLAADS